MTVAPPVEAVALEAAASTIADTARLTVVSSRPQTRRVTLGQFMTPPTVASLMASMIPEQHGDVLLHDPGAGVGALTAAVVERLLSQERKPASITVVAFEVDPVLAAALADTLLACRLLCERAGVACDFQLRQEDYLLAAAAGTLGPVPTLVVMNPPYKKLSASSAVHKTLAAHGLESTNLYTAFWSAALRHLSPAGQFVAITPRSFCNGTYFKRFRREVLASSAVDRLHVYESRQTAFADDEVLQESVITSLIKGGAQGDVTLSSSAGTHDPVVLRLIPFGEVVHDGDDELFIRLPAGDGAAVTRARMSRFTSKLADLGLTVSTGRVVDFRAKAALRKDAGAEAAVPLLYPGHFDGDGGIRWPLDGFKKHNGLVYDETTRKLMVPNGIYTLVRRFSAKEERRRVVAAVYDGSLDFPVVGFENHLNYFHAGGQPLDEDVARGLCVFLNSSLIDDFFRQFNGHTQVNAGDLRSLTYPSLVQLKELSSLTTFGQTAVDAAVEQLHPE